MADKVKESLGITAKKQDNFGEWYTQVVNKAGLIEYTGVSGCLILRPYAYSIWESIVSFIDKEIKERGVQNGYFPLLIPEKNLQKEASHVEGFTPEVAWVTKAGDAELPEKLAVRPTSETIMYEAYKKWIRSYRDLPLRINQWNNVVRWEFKHPMPFLRTREFLWQEGHTAFASKEDAEQEVRDILENVYDKTVSELLAIPALLGYKSEKEKFAGALYTTSGEVLLPNGKAIQGFTSHCLGQNFARAFDITYTDENKEEAYVWQNSWGFTTRTIGIMLMLHGDDKGLVMPPKIAPVQVVIVPIIFKGKEEQVMQKVKELYERLQECARVKLDDRDEHNPGYKYNEWDLKGVPLRIEVGPRDVEAGSVVVRRRDTGEKVQVKQDELLEHVQSQLVAMQSEMFKKAKDMGDSMVVESDNINEMTQYVKHGKVVLAPFCNNPACEEKIKELSGGAKSLNIPFNQPELQDRKCMQCGEDASCVCYFGKSY